MKISRWILAGMRNVSDQNIQTFQAHILRSETFFRISFRFCDNTKKNIIQPDSPDMTIPRMRFACRITKTDDGTDSGRETLV